MRTILQTAEPAVIGQPRGTTEDVSEAAPRGLVPLLGARWALSGRHLVACLFFGALFLYLNYLPLEDSALWLQVHYGNEILENRALPQADAAQPLTAGMRIVDTTWLAQLALASAEAWGGPQGVSDQFAVIGLVYLLVLARVFYVQTGRVSLMLLGMGLVLLFGGSLAISAGPAIFGALCLATLLWLVWRIDRSALRRLPYREGNTHVTAAGAWPCYLLIVLLFVVWANLHGSFLLGLGVLVCCAVGRALEVGWKTRSVASLVTDRPTQRWVLLTECAAAGTLVNPYGVDLILENFRLITSDDLLAMSGWTPVALSTKPGIAFLVSLVLLTFVLRHSRRQVRPTEVLLLVAFGALLLATDRGMIWYVPVFAFAVMPHVGEIVSRRWPRKPHVAESGKQTALAPRHFALTLVCVLVLWCSFAFAPISSGILGGDKRKPEHLFGPGMPFGVAEHFRQHRPESMIHAPTDWADWLVWKNSPEIKVHMTSSFQWVPRSVWADHQRISRAASGCQELLDRLAIDTVVVDKRRQRRLGEALKRSARWEVSYEDDMAFVVERAAPVEDQQHRASQTAMQQRQRSRLSNAHDPCG